VVDSWIISPTDSSSRLEMPDQPKISTSIIRLEPSNARDTTTTLLISETHGCTLTELTLPGTNSSDSMEPTSTTRRVRFLMSLVLRMRKEPMLLQPPREITRTTNNGESSIRTKLLRRSPKE